MSESLSIIIPVYNEAESLPGLHQTILEVIEREGYDAEIIYVDDGSADDSRAFFETTAGNDSRVRVYSLRRNQGKSAALETGFRKARHEVIVTLDGDGQDDPNEIPRFLRALKDGAEMVVGWKYPRHDPAHKVWASGVFNGVVAKATGAHLHDMNCGLKAMRREVVESIHIYGEMHRFLVPLAHLAGFRCQELQVTHHPRKFGESKFGLRRYVEGVFDLVTILFLSHFTVRPLHLFGGLGAMVFGGGFLINLWLTIGWFLGSPVGNRPLLFLGVLLCIVGLQLFSTGLLAEFIVHRFAGSELPPLRYALNDEEPS